MVSLNLLVGTCKGLCMQMQVAMSLLLTCPMPLEDSGPRHPSAYHHPICIGTTKTWHPPMYTAWWSLVDPCHHQAEIISEKRQKESKVNYVRKQWVRKKCKEEALNGYKLMVNAVEWQKKKNEHVRRDPQTHLFCLLIHREDYQVVILRQKEKGVQKCESQNHGTYSFLFLQSYLICGMLNARHEFIIRVVIDVPT